MQPKLMLTYRYQRDHRPHRAASPKARVASHCPQHFSAIAVESDEFVRTVDRPIPADGPPD
jgi:hypothetical protein